MVHDGIVSTLNETDIIDRGHSDVITKALAILQTSWLAIDSIARAARGLSVSQLELATIAFAVCALAMYGFWWHKPFNVERRHVLVKITRIDSNNDSKTSKDKARGIRRNTSTAAREEVCSLDDRVSDVQFFGLAGAFIPNWLLSPGTATFAGPFQKQLPTVALYSTGAAFSAVHLVAWNWRFPSPALQTLWRYSATTALATSFPVLYLAVLEALHRSLCACFGDSLGVSVPFLARFYEWLLRVVSVGVVAVYVVSRTVLLFLTFYCFVSMPASTYQRVQWTALIPRFGG